MSWDDVGFVMASKTRRVILGMLEMPKTPTILANNAQLNLANVSRALTELDKRGLIVCLTPNNRVGRIYSLTSRGRKVLENIGKMK